MQQLQMAQNMGISKEGLDFLASIEEWKKRELYYICLVDGIPVEQLKTNEKRGTDSLNWIYKLRMEYWNNKNAATVGGVFPLGREVEKLKNEVQTVCRESHDIRAAMEKNLEKLTSSQAEVQQETLAAKNQIIEMQKDENERLKQQIKNLKVTLTSLPKDTIEHKQRQQNQIFMAQTASNQNTFSKIKLRVLQEHFKQKKNKRFIDDYIRNPEFSVEQKEFILDCLEEGVDIHEIGKIAIPGLNVEMMERLKRLYLQRERDVNNG